MEEFLTQLKGKTIDVAYGASSIVRGDVVEIRDGILLLRDEDDRDAYVVIDKVTVVWEVKEPHNRPGFVG
jgi:hypothetical protein